MSNVAGDRGNTLGPGNIAREWWYGGCSVVPIRGDGTKSPMVAWRNFQKTPPDLATVKHWFEQQWPKAGVAVICGQVSGNLEMLELEGRAHNKETLTAIHAACAEIGLGNLWSALLSDGYTELSPSGGLHILYRVIGNAVPGNEKVATRPAHDDELNEQEQQLRAQNPSMRITRVLVETRGEGGYVIVAPTAGNCHPSGKPWQRLTGSPQWILTLSWEQRLQLHDAIRRCLHVLDTREIEISPLTVPKPIIERDPNAPLTPVEDFNARASWHDSWFLEQGWRVHHQDGNEIFWTRPGKEWADGHSASTGVRDGGQDCLYVWSTSAGLPVEVPLTKFMVYAHYKFNGDRSLAARSLVGTYGAPMHPPLTELRDEDLQVVEDDAAPQELPDYALENLRYDLYKGNVLTDTGYAFRCRDKYQDRIRYNKTVGDWFVWHSAAGVWAADHYFYADNAVQRTIDETYKWMYGLEKSNPLLPDGKVKKVEQLVKRAQDGYNNARIQATLSRLKAATGIPVRSEQFDADLDLLNLQNGTLNLLTFEMKPHSPDDLITMSFNAEYDPDAECPNFTKYLEDVVPHEEVRAYLQRAIGYSLLGRPRERALFLLHGPSGTGKSVFTDVFTELFGSYGIAAPASTFKLKKQENVFDLHQLRGRRFVSASEMPQKLDMDEELVKRLTGGDQVASRGLHENFVTWTPQCVIWLATNHLPRISSDDDAMWRRIRTIPMKTVIRDYKNEIRGFSAVLTQEANGLLNWALEGLREYRRIGLSEPGTILRDIAEYQQESDTVSSWLNYSLIDGTLVITETDRVSLSYLYEAYVHYCESNGDSKFGKHRFTNRLISLDQSIEIKTVGGARYVYGIAQRKGL